MDGGFTRSKLCWPLLQDSGHVWQGGKCCAFHNINDNQAFHINNGLHTQLALSALARQALESSY